MIKGDEGIWQVNTGTFQIFKHILMPINTIILLAYSFELRESLKFWKMSCVNLNCDLN